MRKYLFLLIIVPVITTHGQIKNAVNFTKYFSKESTVMFSDKTIISEITTLDYNAGKFLITDVYGKKVFLFDAKTGILIADLNAEKTSPGFNWNPLSACFNKDGIFVQNNMPWGYRFDKKGIGRGGMSSKFLGTQYYCFQSNGNIVGLYLTNSSYLSIMSSTGEIIKNSADIKYEYPNIVNRYEGGGIVADENDNIYHITCCDWKISKYDKNLNFLKKIGSRPPNFYKIDNDLINKRYTPGQNDLRNTLKDKSTIMNMFYLSKGKILLQYYTPSRKKDPIGIMIIDTEGNKITKEEIMIDSKIILAKDNKIYFAVQPKGNAVNMPNPVIEVYRYTK